MFLIFSGDRNTKEIGRIPRIAVYLKHLEATKVYFPLSDRSHFAIADCNVEGKLIKTFAILEKLQFNNSDGTPFHLFACMCTDGTLQRERLRLLNREVKNHPSFQHDEESQYCIHAAAANAIGLGDTLIDLDNIVEDITVDQLSLNPLIVGIHDGESYGILSREDRSSVQRIRCRTCRSNVHACSHVRTYKLWCTENEIEFNVEEVNRKDSTKSFSCISENKIPYPLPEKLRNTLDRYESGSTTFPIDLIPPILEGGQKCKHGNTWDLRDPKEQGWLLSDDVRIYKSLSSLSNVSEGGLIRKLYFRPTIGSCGCFKSYDGQEDLLLNLDNKHFFYYGFLYSYLHLMMEGKNPLAAFFRATQSNYSTLSTTSVCSYNIFRLAWNSFARLIDINWNCSFQCPECGPTPSTVICDGTFLGMRKDLIPSLLYNSEETHTKPISGTMLKDRIYVVDSKTRKLLRVFSGIQVTKGIKGKRKITYTGALSKQQYKELMKKLVKEVPILASLIETLVEETNVYIAPDPYKQFFFELSLTSPVVGMFQIGGDQKALHILKQICNNEIDIFDSSMKNELSYLQKRAPLLCNFIFDLKQRNGNLPIKALAVLDDIMKTIVNTFMCCDTNKEYSDVVSNQLSFFPTLPTVHGKGKYKADGQQDKDNCRKEGYRHPTLTPGIFTVYCPHGICYGFEAMTECESPKVPFAIFKTRFPKAPDVIIYDNACNLHKYCLSREPDYFKNTRFLVDKFHWKCHIACSEGYNMERYTACVDTQTINSQINEQANAGLKRLQSQLTYMNADNFMFHISLFLSLKNREKIDKLTVNLAKNFIDNLNLD